MYERRQAMIVERWTFRVNHIYQDEFVELLKAAVEEAGLTPRVCTYEFGPVDTVISDLEFATSEDREAFWGSMDWSQPKVTEYLKRYPDLAEAGATKELLRVH